MIAPKRYYQQERETMAVDRIRELQSRLLVEQVQHVWNNVPYYRKLMQDKGVEPGDITGIQDIWKLPFLTKDDLREAYPYGLLAEPLEKLISTDNDPSSGKWKRAEVESVAAAVSSQLREQKLSPLPGCELEQHGGLEIPAEDEKLCEYVQTVYRGRTVSEVYITRSV